MSIQSEIERISNGVSAAKTVIKDMGGTTSSESVDDLADEIATIPQGSPEPIPQENTYGKLYYQDVIVEPGYSFSSYGCEAEIVDAKKFEGFIKKVGLADEMGGEYFNFELMAMPGEDFWTYRLGMMDERTIEDISTIGLDVTRDISNESYISGNASLSRGAFKTYYLNNIQEIDCLCGSAYEFPDGTIAGSSHTLGFEFGTITPTELKDSFLEKANLYIFSWGGQNNTSNIATIGDNVMKEAVFNMGSVNDFFRGSFPNLTTIGNSFLHGLKLIGNYTSFNFGSCMPNLSAIGDNLLAGISGKNIDIHFTGLQMENIGSYFASDIDLNYLNLPTSVSHIGNGFLRGCSRIGNIKQANTGVAVPDADTQYTKSLSGGESTSTVPSYGISISGNNVNAWKSRFPDTAGLRKWRD